MLLYCEGLCCAILTVTDAEYFYFNFEDLGSGI
jgi:hypothetical protein